MLSDKAATRRSRTGRSDEPGSTISSPSFMCSTYVIEFASVMTGMAPSGELAIEQQPWVGALLRRLGERALKCEPAGADEILRRRQDARVLRLIEIQAARVVAGTHAKPIEPHVSAARPPPEDSSRRDRPASLRSWTIGQQRSRASSGYPPPPECRSSSVSESSRLNASTAKMTKVAKAMSAIQSTLRAGRYAGVAHAQAATRPTCRGRGACPTPRRSQTTRDTASRPATARLRRKIRRRAARGRVAGR